MPVEQPCLTLFAREAVPGAAKTRLAPRLGDDGAARLAGWMIRCTAEQATRHWPGPVRLACWPATARTRMAAEFALPVVAQRGAELGERMLGALADGPGAVLGCDVPHLPGTVLAEAGRRLAAGQAVVGPALDGGFYLLGLPRPVPGLFDGIRFGGDDVHRRLRANAGAAGVDLVELPTLRDIDRPEDLDAVAEGFPALAAVIVGGREVTHG